MVYAAERHQDPLPFNQFVLTRFEVVPQGSRPVTFKIDPGSVDACRTHGTDLLLATGRRG